MSNRNWNLYFALVQALSAETVAMELARKLSSDEMNDLLETIAREHDLDYNEE